jgi:hypothetical protein
VKSSADAKVVFQLDDDVLPHQRLEERIEEHNRGRGGRKRPKENEKTLTGIKKHNQPGSLSRELLLFANLLRVGKRRKMILEVRGN